MDRHSGNKALARLTKLAKSRDDLETEIIGLIQLLRSPDLDGYCAVSWGAIAGCLGVTRQAAQARYDRHV